MVPSAEDQEACSVSVDKSSDLIQESAEDPAMREHWVLFSCIYKTKEVALEVYGNSGHIYMLAEEGEVLRIPLQRLNHLSSDRDVHRSGVLLWRTLSNERWVVSLNLEEGQNPVGLLFIGPIGKEDANVCQSSSVWNSVSFLLNRQDGEGDSSQEPVIKRGMTHIFPVIFVNSVRLHVGVRPIWWLQLSLIMYCLSDDVLKQNSE